jgi:Ca-activated chloride channel family protein
VSFATPLVLLGLLVLPALAGAYAREQQRRRRALVAFVTPPLVASVAPARSGWRRHVPYALLALAVALLLVAAAKPQRSVLVPIRGATVMLANDVSDSMTATDVSPSRLRAASRAARRFLHALPAGVQVGSVTFARRPTLLQSPTSDHRLTAAVIAQLKPGGGGTAIGEAILTALQAIRTAPKIDGRRPPGAIVLISDGTSNVGISPLVAARRARSEHVQIDTVAIGTAHGMMLGRRDGRTAELPVPVSAGELAQIAATSGGRAYRALTSADANAIYSALARKLGHRRAERPLTAVIAGAGLALLALSGGVSLGWFGRIAQ